MLSRMDGSAWTDDIKIIVHQMMDNIYTVTFGVSRLRS